MVKVPVDLSSFLPIDRNMAAEITSVAERYESMITLERNGIMLNVKSMIGLLSQSIPKDGKMVLVVSGADEVEASKAMVETLK